MAFHRRRPLAERFREKVDQRGPDECWPWLASITTHGYGQIAAGGRGAAPRRAHVVAYELTHGGGRVPVGLVVMHSCDNPPCVNPAHLSLGTQGDNMRDAFARGRGVISPSYVAGEDVGSAKLTWSDVGAIRRLKADGVMQKDLAAMYRVGDATISNIVRGVTWRRRAAS